jgi:ribosomal protein L16 Arg81 hydroxylase
MGEDLQQAAASAGAAATSRWLGRLEAAGFWRDHFRRQPFASAGGGEEIVPLVTWDTLDRVLAAPGPIDLMTVRAGQLVACEPPRGRQDAQSLFRSGVSTVVRSAERHDRALASLVSALGAAAGGEAHGQLYATPAATNSYGWHYDFEDVFIVQTAGAKDYYFRANTVANEVVLGDRPDFTAVTRETTPIFTARLLPGDWLYIPARTWHLVKCLEDALSISTGVMSEVEVARARRIPAGWGAGGRTSRS